MARITQKYQQTLVLKHNKTAPMILLAVPYKIRKQEMAGQGGQMCSVVPNNHPSAQFTGSASLPRHQRKEIILKLSSYVKNNKANRTHIEQKCHEQKLLQLNVAE